MRSSALLAAMVLTACGEEVPFEGIPCTPSTTAEDPSYDADQMICVDLSIAESDFEELRVQTRFGGGDDEQWPQLIATTAMSCSEPYPDGYTYFPADISVDGLEAREVGVRRKGFLGSVVDASERPSLKVSADEYRPDQLLGTQERLTLNNNDQDGSRTRACLALSVFDDAGYPAPRCNLANVMVNGEPLGAYTHVEPMKKRFLRRAFGNDEGSLYEGTVADFTNGHLARLPESLGRWESKTGATDLTGAPLRSISDALLLPDDQLESALGAVLDLDAFFEFWALETLVGHNDGYAANTNNFFVYFDPDRGGRAVFVPWGTDAAFWGGSRGYATGELVRRLSRHPELNQRYLDALQRLLDDVWDEDELRRRIAQSGEQVKSAEKNLEAYDWYAEQLEDWISRRRRVVQKLIDEGGAPGSPEQGPCTGSEDPGDFVLVAELGTVASMGCSHSTPSPAWGLGWLARRR